MASLRVLGLLTTKALRSVLRQESAVWFLVSSTSLVFGALLFIYFVSKGSYYQFSSSVSSEFCYM
jgi:hypothetical protein